MGIGVERFEKEESSSMPGRFYVFLRSPDSIPRLRVDCRGVQLHITFAIGFLPARLHARFGPVLLLTRLHGLVRKPFLSSVEVLEVLQDNRTRMSGFRALQSEEGTIHRVAFVFRGRHGDNRSRFQVAKRRSRAIRHVAMVCHL